MALLEVNHLSVSYGPVKALNRVSLEVAEGEIVALLGVNGAGKSTILKTITGLLKPEEGQIRFQGEDIQGLKPETILQKGIAMVPEGRDIFTGLTIEENLRLGGYARRKGKTFADDLESLFKLFPILKERLNQAGGLLSGGEQQQLAIARALMSKPRLLILDEPSLGLAPVLVDSIFQLIARLSEEGTTILLVEQNVVRSLEVVDRVYLLNSGQIEDSGTAEAMRHRLDEVSQTLLGGEVTAKGDVHV